MKGLGDRVAAALAAVGVNDRRVSKWLGRKCGCKRRREKLNRLGLWAAAAGKRSGAAAKVQLLKMLGGK